MSKDVEFGLGEDLLSDSLKGAKKSLGDIADEDWKWASKKVREDKGLKDVLATAIFGVLARSLGYEQLIQLYLTDKKVITDVADLVLGVAVTSFIHGYDWGLMQGGGEDD